MARKFNSMESTYQGYISSTHDALLIFECVRRGIMPKVKRRLREEERKYIRSGQVFVFDERESGIKRWTDGLLWSPSRILWNFLVYRQVDKKFNGRGGSGGQEGGDDLTQALDSSPFGNEARRSSSAVTGHQEDPYALGVESSYTEGMVPGSASRGSASPTHRDEIVLEQPRRQSDPATTSWQSNGMVCTETVDFAMFPSRRDTQDERNLVGSLRSSYPFAKGGLCKKTISIQVDGSTQHLISYYTVDDVRSGRLRTPSSLPEITSLPISPLLLTKTSFRFPPAIIMGPDGVPRFRGEEGIKMDGSMESGVESSGSGNEYRQLAMRRGPMQPIPIPNQDVHFSFGAQLQHPQGQAMHGAPRSYASYNTGGMMNLHKAPLPHQIGGSGVYQPSNRRRSSEETSGHGRYAPYSVHAAGRGRASLSGPSVSTSPPNMPKTPYGLLGGSTAMNRMEGISDQMHYARPLPPKSGQLDDLGAFYNEHQQQANGLPVISDAGEYHNEDQDKQQLLQHMLAEQQRMQGKDVVTDTASFGGQWTQSDEAMMIKMAVAAAAADPSSSGSTSSGQRNEGSLETPGQYHQASQPREYWQDAHTSLAYGSQQHSENNSATVSPLPSHASGSYGLTVSKAQDQPSASASSWSQQPFVPAGNVHCSYPASTLDERTVSPPLQAGLAHQMPRSHPSNFWMTERSISMQSQT